MIQVKKFLEMRLQLVRNILYGKFNIATSIIHNIQKKTAKKGDSSRSLSSILSLTDSISSASSRLSSSISHSRTDSSFCRSPTHLKILDSYYENEDIRV